MTLLSCSCVAISDSDHGKNPVPEPQEFLLFPFLWNDVLLLQV